VTTDDAPRIDFDLSCRACRYVLRGVVFDGVCPECGAPVASSLRDDLILFAPARVRRRLRAGAWVLLGAIGVALAVAMIHGATLAIWGLGRIPSPPPIIVYTTFAAVVPVVGTIGVWLATPREHVRGAPGARAIARWGSAAASVLAQRWWVAPWGVPSFASILFGWPTTFAERIVTAGTTIAFLVHARLIAQRLPDDRLARRCGQVTIAYAIAWCVLTAQYLAWLVIGPWTDMVAEIAMVALHVVYMAFAAVVLVRMLRRLNAIERTIAPAAPRPVALVRLALPREREAGR
jgi:hypothetical protein